MSPQPGARPSGRHKEAHDRGGRADSANRRFGRPHGSAGILWSLPAPFPQPRGAADSRPSVSQARDSSMPPLRSPGARFCPAARRASAWAQRRKPRGGGAELGPGAGATGSAGVRAAAAAPHHSVPPGLLSTMCVQLLQPPLPPPPPPQFRTRLHVPPRASSTCP